MDDNDATVKMLRGALEKFGHKVLTALSGEEALNSFSEYAVDLVICDLGMPGLNGWQVGRAVKFICKERDVAKTRFIILTGWDDQALESRKIAESGIDGVIRKPIDMNKLLDIVREVA